VNGGPPLEPDDGPPHPVPPPEGAPETDGPTEDDPDDDDGPNPEPDDPRIGPGDAGGRNGTSMVSVVPSASSFEPAVMAARVGTDAKPTKSATMSTYRRVGPEKPVSAR
jgi:hypothetical protein